MSAVIGTRQYREFFFGDSIPSDVQGGITSAMPGGAFVGSICSGFLSDKMGRKYSIQVGACIWSVSVWDYIRYWCWWLPRLIGCTLSCTSQNIGMLIVGRFINGRILKYTMAYEVLTQYYRSSCWNLQCPSAGLCFWSCTPRYSRSTRRLSTMGVCQPI
jgi:MFS family permease